MKKLKDLPKGIGMTEQKSRLLVIYLPSSMSSVHSIDFSMTTLSLHNKLEYTRKDYWGKKAGIDLFYTDLSYFILFGF
jgi:hypothetical protein